jgi:glucose/arabinose dehydrogenase
MESRALHRTAAGCCSLAALVSLSGGCPAVTTPPPSGSFRVAVQPIASGFTSPVALVDPRDGSARFFVVDQIGLIRVIDAEGRLRDTPFLDLRERLVVLTPTYDERGLLGMAVHPDFASNRRFFVYFNVPPESGSSAGANCDAILAEFAASSDDANVADAGSERVLLRFSKPQANHNGGQLVFGPDGYLYIGIGDGGGAGDTGFGHTGGLGNAQDESVILGKILRIDVDHGDPYAVPADNPFVGDAGALPEIYALGFRNPWRFSFDAAGRLILGDVGQSLYEEIDVVEPGGNYGWNIREGNACFDPANSRSPPADCPNVSAAGEALRAPVLAYAHTDNLGRAFGTSVIGGFVYRGTAIPALLGQYVFADFSAGFLAPGGKVFAAPESAGGAWTFEEIAIVGQPGSRLGRYVLALAEDSAGELYVLTSRNGGPVGTTGEVLKLVAAEE